MAEFHYHPGKWKELKRQLPAKWIPLDDYLALHRPPNISNEIWEQSNFYDDEGPKSIFVWIDAKRRRRISSTSILKKTHIAAADLFLESMRPIIRASISHQKAGEYVTPGEMKRELIACNKRISKLIDQMNSLPLAVKNELIPVIDKQKQSQWMILETISNLPKKMPKNFIRQLFLHSLYSEYEAAYGEPPNHTFNRELGPEVGFFGVAYTMCKWAQLPANKGIEDVFAAMKAVRAPTP